MHYKTNEQRIRKCTGCPMQKYHEKVPRNELLAIEELARQRSTQFPILGRIHSC